MWFSQIINGADVSVSVSCPCLYLCFIDCISTRTRTYITFFDMLDYNKMNGYAQADFTVNETPIGYKKYIALKGLINGIR